MGIQLSVLFLFISVLFSVYLYIFVYIYRVYQHRNVSLHSHPLVPHKNGQLFNNKSGGISRTLKSYHVRDIHWTQKHMICVRVTAKAGKTAPKNIGQHAGNTLETKHSVSNATFTFIPWCPVYWKFIPSTQVKMIFALFIKNTKSLFRKYKKNPENFSPRHKALIHEINQIHIDYRELNEMREKLDEFGHGWLWWPKIDRTLDKWLKGIKAQECIKRVSRILASDYSRLFLIVYNSKETNYGRFEDVDFILKDKKKLKWLQRQLYYRMTITEIKTIIYKEWTASSELEFEEIFDIKPEEEKEELLEIPKSPGKKEKKKSKTFVNILFFFYISLHVCQLIYVQIYRDKKIFKNPKHIMYNKCNELHEYFNTIHFFAKKNSVQAGRQARMKFTHTDTIPKRKKRKKTNKETESDSDSDSDDSDNNKTNDKHKNKNTNKNKTVPSSRRLNGNRNNANNNNDDNSSSLDFFDSFRCNFQTNASPIQLNHNNSNDSNERNKNKNTLPYISDGDDDYYEENENLSTLNDDEAPTNRNKGGKIQKKSKKKKKKKKEKKTKRKKPTKSKKKSKKDSDSEYDSEVNEVAQKSLKESQKRRSRRLQRQREIQQDPTRGETPDSDKVWGFSGNWLGNDATQEDEQSKEQRMDYDVKLDNFEVSNYVYLFISQHICLYFSIFDCHL